MITIVNTNFKYGLNKKKSKRELYSPCVARSKTAASRVDVSKSPQLATCLSISFSMQEIAISLAFYQFLSSSISK